jgi:iron complex outermembrane recepter protein
MKPIPLFVLLLAVTVVCGQFPALHAAEPSPGGAITGRVQLSTGQYLGNATVAVKGSNLSTQTDPFGFYRLTGVPRGAVVLQVMYTGQEPSETTVNVPAGGSVAHDITLKSTVSDIVTMQKFSVNDRELIAEEIATHEQRSAPNIKNVIATDAFGDITGGNLGDFLQYVPGLTVEYSDIEVAGVSARGFGSALTNYSSDGAPLAGGDISATRRTRLNHLGLNNLARIEVTKVPTPANPADSMGGSVNLVSKSSFDSAMGNQLNWGVNLFANSKATSFSRQPHGFDRELYLIYPGVTFDATWAITRNLGIAVSGDSAQQYNEQHISTTTWNAGGTATGASFANPYFQSFQLTNNPRDKRRKSLSLKVDWRVTPNSVLSLGAQGNNLYVHISGNTFTQNVGTNGTPTPATGTRMTFGPDFTDGATGRGSASVSSGSQKQSAIGNGANLRYRFDNGDWNVNSGVSLNKTRRFDYSAPADGMFNGTSIALRTPARVSFEALEPDRPGRTRAFDNNNQEIDLFDINNYVQTGVTDSSYFYRTGVESADVSARRKLGWLPFPATLQVGAVWSHQWMNGRRWNEAFTYNGPDGNPGTPDSPAPYLSRIFSTQGSPFGYKNIPWVSVVHMFSAWQANPNLFSQTLAQQVAAETFRIQNSLQIDETISAAYVQGEMKLLKNRLNVLTGVRYERTVDVGKGPFVDPNAVYVRNSSGALARTPAGALIRKPEAGAVGSMEELRLVRQERTAHGRGVFADYFPSVHLTYNITDNLLARAAYAYTYGRPNFGDIIATTTIQERTDLDGNDNPDVLPGSITVTNPNLIPWNAHNYDLSLEYYTPKGGVFSVGAFQKDIRDFFGSGTKIATVDDLNQLELDPRYVGFEIRTKFNAGTARVSGMEFSARHSLRRLGAWGRYFSAFVNGTKLRLEGNQSSDFSTFIPTTANWGLVFRREKVSVGLRWNYRGEVPGTLQTAFGPDARNYSKAITKMDLTAAYQLTPRLSLAGNVKNLLDEDTVRLRYGSETPAYARQSGRSQYGAMISLGIKGTF